MDDSCTRTLLWREDNSGAFVADTGEFIMKVRPSANRQFARYMVSRHFGGLVGSGTAENLGLAMNAALRMAVRFRLN